MDLHKASFYVVNLSPPAFSCEFLQDSGLISAFIVFLFFHKYFSENLGTVASELVSGFHFNQLSYFLET